MSKKIKEFIIRNSDLMESVELCHKEFKSIRDEVNTRFFNTLQRSYANCENLKNRENRENRTYLEDKVISMPSYTIMLEYAVDGDGIFFGYKAICNGEIVCDINKVNKYKILLKEINSSFRSSPNLLGWLNPNPFKRSQKFSTLPINTILNYYSDPKLLESIVDKIVEQEGDIRKEFLSLISKLK